MDLQTWSPFQSAKTQAICDHMTEKEKSQISARSGLYGVWVSITLGIPVAGIFFYASWLTFCLFIPIIVIHICCIPIWQRKQKEFLCNTEWAKQQGIASNDLKLFRKPLGRQ